MAKLEIGLKQARRLCQMSAKDRLPFIAEGLPLILKSARRFWAAAQQIDSMPREAEVLEGFAEEEAAKILILLDIIRCPAALADRRIGKMSGWFYDHLARLLYARAVSWSPMHVSQLREYIDRERPAHYLEGFYAEYIVPNWQLFLRESRLYADIEAYEDGQAGWSSPHVVERLWRPQTPPALAVVEALATLGVYSEQGLRAVADIWGQLEFKDAENLEDAHRLTYAMLERLIRENLPAEEATDDHVQSVYRHWQMPMYNLDFSLINVPRADLEEERERAFWAEAGYY